MIWRRVTRYSGNSDRKQQGNECVTCSLYQRALPNTERTVTLKGVILNQMSPMLYPRMKELLEKETGLSVLGYVPKVEDCVIESRHLGLVLPEEIPELKLRLLKLADVLQKSTGYRGDYTAGPRHRSFLMSR